MNWLGRAVARYIAPTDTVLSVGCGVMQEIAGLPCLHFTGIDIYRPYVDKLCADGVDARMCDITVNSADDALGMYDHVLALDVLEHIENVHIDNVLNRLKRHARKTVIVYTPKVFHDNVTENWLGQKQDINGWLDNDPSSPYKGLGVNDAQRHVSLITQDELRAHGFECWTTTTDANTFAVWKRA